VSYDDAAIAAHPQAPAAELARIVNQRPDLRAIVAGNPAAQPALLDWLASLQDPAVDAALAGRRTQPAPPPQAPAPQAAPAAPAAPATSWAPQTTSAGQSWAPQGAPRPAAPQPPAAPAWGQQPPAAAPAWGEQPSFAAVGTATGVLDVPLQPYESEPRSSRKKLWIGLAVTAVVLIGAGAGAAYLMVFSKLGGAESPEAAVTQLIEGAVHKDGIAMYGVLAPSEVSSLGDMVSPVSAATDGGTDPDQLLDLLGALDIDLTGLSTSSETIGDGLAKVSVTGGKLTVDGDSKEIVAQLAKVYGPMLGTSGMSDDETSAMWDEAATELDKNLPWSVDAADLTWSTDAGINHPFLVSVKEGGSWYVSPLMSVGEYIFVSGSDLTRGAMPSTDSKGAASPEEAGTAFAQALGDLFTGDAGPLADVLPRAEARFAAVYGQAWLDDADDGSFEDVPTVEEATFSSKPIGGDLARLAATKLVFGGSDPLTIEGTCATDESGTKTCLADNPTAKQLGLDQVGLVAVKSDGGWHVSVLATLGDASRIVADHIRSAKDAGTFDEDSLLGGLWMLSSGLTSTGVEDLDLSEPSSPDTSGYTFDEDGNLIDENGDVVDLDSQTGGSIDPGMEIPPGGELVLPDGDGSGQSTRATDGD